MAGPRVASATGVRLGLEFGLLGGRVDIETVIQRVDRILIEQFELDASKVVPAATLRDDLELDSLDGLDLMVALEKEFGFRLDDKVILNMKTVADIHDYIRQNFSAKVAELQKTG